MLSVWDAGLPKGLVAALLVLLVTTVAVVVLRPVAVSAGLVDRPEGRRTHDMATPAVGGVAIVIGIAPLVLYALPVTMQLRGFAIAAFITLAAGVADDLWRVRWPIKLAANVAAAVALIYLGGIRIDHIGSVFGFLNRSLGPLSVPLTIIATVGIINAVNMIDGVDGLAGVTCLVATLLIAVAAAYAGNWRLSIGMLLIDGALAAFLLFNLRTPWNPRATLFLGNAGADVLGLVIAAACFRLTQNGHHPVGTQLAPFLLAPPVVDCLVLMVRRARAGKSPFVGDRNHFHHLLWEAGYSANTIVLIIAGSTALVGVFAAVALKLHAPAPLFTLAFLALLIAHFRFTHVREQAIANLAKARLAVASVLPRPRPAAHLAHRGH